MKTHRLLLTILLLAGCEKTSNVPAIQDEVTAVTNHYKHRFDELSKRLAVLENRGPDEAQRLSIETRRKLTELKVAIGQAPAAISNAAKSDNARIDLTKLRDDYDDRFEKAETELGAALDQIEQSLAYAELRPKLAEPTPAKAEPPPPPAAKPDPAESDGFAAKLSSGKEIKGAANGIEAQLVTFLGDDKQQVDKDTWFNFDKLVFQSGGATLDMAVSKAQLTNIAEVLAAFPKVKLKIGGYTDNTGDAATNKKLSGERATAVKKELVALGVATDRLTTEGYGAEHPVCAKNDTDECKAQNRRIAVRVTAK